MRKYKIIIVENDEDEQMFMNEGFDDSGSFEILAQLKNGDMLELAGTQMQFLQVG